MRSTCARNLGKTGRITIACVQARDLSACLPLAPVPFPARVPADVCNLGKSGEPRRQGFLLLHSLDMCDLN